MTMHGGPTALDSARGNVGVAQVGGVQNCKLWPLFNTQLAQTGPWLRNKKTAVAISFSDFRCAADKEAREKLFHATRSSTMARTLVPDTLHNTSSRIARWVATMPVSLYGFAAPLCPSNVVRRIWRAPIG